jgi:hypothetical protein
MPLSLSVMEFRHERSGVSVGDQISHGLVVKSERGHMIIASGEDRANLLALGIHRTVNRVVKGFDIPSRHCRHSGNACEVMNGVKQSK